MSVAGVGKRRMGGSVEGGRAATALQAVAERVTFVTPSPGRVGVVVGVVAAARRAAERAAAEGADHTS